MLRRQIIFFIACALAMTWSFSACVVVNKDGKEIFKIEGPNSDGKKDGGDTKKDDEAKKEQERKEAEQALKEASKKVGEAKTAKQETKKQGTDSTEETQTSSHPWWYRPKIKVNDLKENSSDGEAGKTETEKSAAKDEAIPGDQDAKPVPTEETKPEVPVKKVIQQDKFLQQVPATLWTDTYARQTSKKTPAARKASMEQVKQGIDSGYGAAYVTKMEKAISLDRTNGYAYYFLARGRFDKGDWKGARNFGENAVQKLSSDLKFRAAARVLLSKSNINLENLEDAEKQAKAAAEDDPENTEAKILLMRFSKE